jgi:hypothetical protein
VPGPEGPEGPEGPQGDPGPTGATGAAGADGTDGTDGTDGVFGGNSLKYTYSTTTTDSDPGAGVMRFNNADWTISNWIYADNSDFFTALATPWFDAIDLNIAIPKGYLRVFKETNPAVFAIYELIDIAAASGYYKLNIAYITGSGTLSASDPVILSYSEKGEQGDPGPDGGAILSAFWQFSGTTTISPGAGQMRTNAGNTLLWVSETDTDGMNRSVGLSTVVEGSRVLT